MQDQENTAIGFWPTYAVVLIGLLVVMIVDGHAWGTLWAVKAAGLVLALIAGSAYFVWRGAMSKAKLVRTGLEWVYALMLLALFGSWILSPDPRQGLFRVGWLLGYLLLFYILADALEAGADRNAAIAALLTVSGGIILLAALETSMVYSQWWRMVGSRQILPPYPYRPVSLVGHSSAMMGLVNLCAPLALFAFLRTRNKTQRILLAFWLVAFLIVVPFCSSPGGMIGTAVWTGGFFIYLLWKKNPLEGWSSLRYRGKIIVILLGIGILAAVGIAAYLVSMKFLQHPAQEVNVFGSQSEIWANALQIWLANPWFGTGPDRFGFGYLQAVSGTPPGYWASHAHSLPVQILAEFGIVGEIALLALFVENLRWFWKRYRLIDDSKRELAVVVLAGCAAWTVQMLVDDLTGFSIVMVSLILLLAYLVSLPETPLERWPQVSNNLIILPGLMLAFGAGWALWAYAPMSRGVTALQLENCDSSAPFFAASKDRDPNFSFYATQAGYAWAGCGSPNDDETALVKAHQSFEKSLEIEPDVSLFWANQAVVDWQTTRYKDKAVPNLQHAVALSPNEPSYVLNLGWIYEEESLDKAAISAYTRTLDLQPLWVDHPFWQLTGLRQQVIHEWERANPSAKDAVNTYWFEAREAIETGKYQQAELLLANAKWVGEPSLAVQVSQGLLAEAQGDYFAVIAAYSQVADTVQQRILHTPHRFMLYYTVWMNRRQGITNDFVPGYLQLDRDYGQFAALKTLYEMYHESGECKEAGEVWQVWQQTVHGGALEALSPEPDC